MRNDSQLSQAVHQELRKTTSLVRSAIMVEVEDGVVALSGSVGSNNERVAAEQAAHRVAGVRDVVNDLRVQPPDALTNLEIAHALRAGLEWDTELSADEVRSTVSDGWVTL
jgi:osmotically-inducible protein OsmY